MEILEKILDEEKNKKIDFSGINNAINSYNKDKSDNNKIKIISDFSEIGILKEEVKNIKEKNKILEMISKMENKEKRKKDIEERKKNFAKAILSVYDLILIADKLNLGEKFKNRTSNLKSNFEYQLTIDDSKDLKPYQIEEPIKEKSVIEKVLKYKKQIVLVIGISAIAGILNLSNGKSEKRYKPQEHINLPSILEKTNIEKIKEKTINVTIARINTIIREIGIGLEELKNTTQVEKENLGELEIKLLKYKINEMNSDLKLANKSENSLFIRNDFHIKGKLILGNIQIMFNNKSIYNMLLNIPVKQKKSIKD